MSCFIDLQSFAWDVAKVRGSFQSTMVDRILALELPQHPMDDFVYWKFAWDGKFSVKSAYATFAGHDVGHRFSCSARFPSGWWPHFWGLPVLPRWKLFVWKLMFRKLSVGAVLQQHGNHLCPVCLFCAQAPQTLEHLFRDCAFVQQFWMQGLYFGSFCHWVAP